ncbi:hypothetical protein D3C75_330920 [compost metagenome]
MSVAIISYSFTGNNEALAVNVAKALSTTHIRIKEPKPRTTGAIIIDMMLNRAPQVKPAPDQLGTYDMLLFVGPVWMGHVAAPLRAYLKHLKSHPHRYGFLSISGGADGANPKLLQELRKRTGADPAVLLDLHIADLLPNKHQPADRQATSAYRLNSGDLERLTQTVVEALRGTL